MYCHYYRNNYGFVHYQKWFMPNQDISSDRAQSEGMLVVFSVEVVTQRCAIVTNVSKFLYYRIANSCIINCNIFL